MENGSATAAAAAAAAEAAEVDAVAGGEGDLLPIRRLEISDHAKGFVELLGQLSPCPALSADDFRDRFGELAALGDDHLVCVAEDPRSGRIVATGSVFVERKFLRGGARSATSRTSSSTPPRAGSASATACSATSRTTRRPQDATR
uniref:Glucosamine 6-phosphate N-acetyltransferase n=1 Tax=Ananas comosus var. bracteatus TaxID=296719 RepID=A0A6V7QR09_ANACO